MVYTYRYLGRAQMPWKECKRMDERLSFIARLLEGEKIASERWESITISYAQ
jgi:hypothetical protein